MFRSLALLLLTALPASAERAVATPSGPLTIRGEAYDLQLVVGDWVQALPDTAHAEVAGQVGNLFLIAMAPGGNACPAYFAWLDTSPGRIALSEQFGTCSDLVKISDDAETLTVTMPSMVPGEGMVAFVYDGKTITEAALGLPQSGHPPGSDPKGWIGEHPYALVNSADWEATLTALLGGAGTLQLIRETMELSSGMAAQGDWIAGEAVGKFTEDRAAIALSRDGSALVVAFRPRDGAPKLWGAARGLPLPPSILSVMTGH